MPVGMDFDANALEQPLCFEHIAAAQNCVPQHGIVLLKETRRQRLANIHLCEIG